MLYNCLSWYKFVNTHLYHSKQLYNIQIITEHFGVEMMLNIAAKADGSAGNCVAGVKIASLFIDRVAVVCHDRLALFTSLISEQASD